MQTQNFEEAVEMILLQDQRYDHEAYQFVREALDYTQKAICKANKGKVRHITGQELLAGVRSYALSQYGPMTLTLLQDWGIKQCQDFGEIVFNLVENGLFSKTENDSRDDFKDGYDFEEAFTKPFLPSRPLAEVPKKAPASA